MNWNNSKLWVENLEYGGFSNWRLPSIKNSIEGANQTSSEIGHMFYNNLGNSSQQDVNCFPNCLVNTTGIDASTGSNINFLNLNIFPHTLWFNEENSSTASGRMRCIRLRKSEKPENPGFNNYGIFWLFYGDFIFK